VKFGWAMLFSLGLLLSPWAQPAAAQWRHFPRFQAVAQRKEANAAKNFAPAPKANGGPVRQGQPNLRGVAGLPPKWVENLREMPPEQQERFLQNNRAFQNLPPERQTQVRKNLENWNKLSPAERDEIRDREQILERMSAGGPPEVDQRAAAHPSADGTGRAAGRACRSEVYAGTQPG
jgi:hypothetical protein